MKNKYVLMNKGDRNLLIIDHLNRIWISKNKNLYMFELL
jgi:ligand-binding sensor domain-containing protein